MKKITYIFIFLVLIPGLLFGQEVISDYNNTTLPVLNEELRKINNDIKGNSALISSAIPSGLIVMWSGSIASIPSGWALCNGSNGTPDLRDKFVMGAGSTYAVNATGGSTTQFFATPNHQHGQNSAGYATQDLESAGGLGMALNGNAGQNFLRLTGLDTGYGTYLVRTGTDNSGAGTTDTKSILNPYYALAYIMKL